ncbi:hypothetical protein EDC04DRAFT_2914831 [Pisolithus marmoratus]|nr:hypothetical protein EDC04DRAFT_2914831 [Pisolithus marmoratus]
MDGYDRERRDTKDPKTIGQRNRIIQQWWESVSAERKAEAGRAVEKWNKLGAPKDTHDLYRRKNLPNMARDLVEHRTMGSHVVMFVAHEAGEEDHQVLLNAENILTDYLLTAPVEEDSAEKHEVEISLDEDGNLEMPTWAGQKLKVQQNLERAVFQAAYGHSQIYKEAQGQGSLGLADQVSHGVSLLSQSIPEGFMMKDPSKWTKADLGLLWDHWQTLEAEEKVIVSFIGHKKEDAPLSRQFDRRPVGGSSKKREWMDPEDDSEEEVGRAGVPCSDAGPSGQMVETGEVANKGVEVTMDAAGQAPEESSPAWHASKDQIEYLKSLSIMPRYQVLVDLVEALPEEEHGKGREIALPQDLGCQVFASGNSFGWGMFLEGPWAIVECKVHFLLIGCAQEVEEDYPLISHLQFLVNSELGIQRAENVMDIVGLIVSRLEQSSTGMKEPQEGNEGASMGGSDREDKEKEEEEAPAVVPTQKRKRAESGIVTRGKKVAKQDGEKGKKDGENGKKGVRTQNQTRRAMGL